jgi:hypothetical protein
LSEEVKSLLILNLYNNDALVNMDHDDLEDEDETDETDKDWVICIYIYIYICVHNILN